MHIYFRNQLVHFKNNRILNVLKMILIPSLGQRKEVMHMTRSNNCQLNQIMKPMGAKWRRIGKEAMSLIKVFMTKCPVTDLEDPENLQCPITVLQCLITEKGNRKCLEITAFKRLLRSP